MGIKQWFLSKIEKRWAEAFVRLGENGETEKLIEMIQKGANYNIQNADGNTALIAACFAQKTETVKILLAAGADTELRNSNGQNALIAACLANNSYIVSLIIPSSLLRDIKDCSGATALMYACASRSSDIIKILSPHCDVNIQDSHGITALMISAMYNHIMGITLLLENGADPSIVSTAGKTALSYAQAGGFDDIVNLLQKHKELS